MKRVVLAIMIFGGTIGGMVYGMNVSEAVVVSFQEKTYSKIDVKEVPVAILQEITEKYPGFSVTQAFVSTDKEYKLMLADGKSAVTVYYNANAEFVKEQK